MMQTMEPWQWPEDEWRGHIDRVRAGKPLVGGAGTSKWPENAKAAVLLSFDSDHETLALRDGETSPGRMAQGEFGARVAVPRILDLLGRHGVNATFFMPAVCALLRPDEAPTYVAHGHEVGVHGWIHERNALLPAEVELELVSRSVRVFEDQLGQRLRGIRTPSWDFSPQTFSVIRELGFDYDSSLMADTEPYELLDRGEPTGVVEIPVEWIRDDAPYFVMDRYSSLRPQIAPRDILQIWMDEFDAAREDGGLFQLTLHPHIIGHRSRLRIVDELLAHIRRFDDVWVGTHGALASHVRTGL